MILEKKTIFMSIVIVGGLLLALFTQRPVVLPNACVLTLSVLSVPSAGNSETNAPLSYTLLLKNSGRVTCQNVSLSAYYGESEIFVSSSPEPTSSDYYWNIGMLKSGAEFSVRITSRYEGGVDEERKHEACAAADNGADGCIDTPLGDTQTGADVSRHVAATAPKVPEYGTWVWEKQSEITDADRSRIIDQARSAGFNALYITIDDYLDLLELPSRPERDQKIMAYSDSLSRFIGLARQNGIAVDAESGWRDWGEGSNRAKAFAVVDFVLLYNRTHTNTFRNIQYDVEPYLLPAYESNKASVLKNFIGLVDDTLARIGAADLGFVVVIPHFYDSSQAWTPSFSYKNKTAHAYTHLLATLDRKLGNGIIIMAYRNFAGGKDGTIALSDAEISEASRGTHVTRVIVAQETGEVQPGYVTFFGRSKKELSESLN